MKIKYCAKIAVVWIGLILISGCSKVLDTPNYGFYEEKDILKTELDAHRLLIGAYSEMTKKNWRLFHNCYWLVLDFDNDHVVGPNWAMGNVGSGAFPAFWGMPGVWVSLFAIIGRCNQVLEKIPGMSIDETVKNNILGEAYALRGWTYFSLVRMYGQLPIRTRSLEADPSVNVPRSPVKDVYKLIIDDLTTSIPLLLPKGDPKGGSIGRINKPAAQAILAKVYLTMASGNQKGVSISVRAGKDKEDNTVKNYTQNGVEGYESFPAGEYFKKSSDLSAEIIEGKAGGTFDLVPYGEVFTKAQVNGPEALWYLQFKVNTDVINDLSVWYNPAIENFPSWGGWVWVSDNFYNSFEETDERILKGIYHRYISDGYPFVYPWRDEVKYAWQYNGRQSQSWLNRAFLTKYSDRSKQDGENDPSVFMERFANVLLMFAEAENEVKGPTAAAYTALNRVRKRSNASDAPAGMNKDQFRSFVFDERGKELVQECARKFDLVRRGIYIQVMSSIVADQENNLKTRTEKHLLYPIPQTDVDASKGAIVQNPGW